HPTMARRPGADNAFRMLGVNLKTHQHAWDADMTGDVLGAPVAAAGMVYFTCTDGRVFCLKSNTGGSDWHVVAHASSAPVVAEQVLAVTTEEKTFRGTWVGIRRYTIADGELKDEKPLAPTLVSAAAASVHGGWDYQGPKLAYANNCLFNAPGNTINAVALDSGKDRWRAVVTGDGLGRQANSLTPPALGKEKLYLGSAKGHILALKQTDGSLAYSYKLSEPLASQPILAEGNLYFGTASGLLVCLKLNDKDAEGWYAWGGDAQHNKVK
ncbi:MAG: PQQ-binding-like beta-propeller repeat protein, partial [Phycisphaerae bacterium]